MIRKALSASAGLVVLAASSMPSLAGDWNNGAGTLKDRGSAAVPVPAPHLAPDEDKSRGWYLRGTLGYSLKPSGSITSIGTDMGAAKSFTDVDAPVAFGFGYGAYVNRNVRWDVTGDFRSEQKLNRTGSRYYEAQKTNEAEMISIQGLAADGSLTSLQTRSWDTHIYGLQRTDDIRLSNHTLLANLYYEPSGMSASRPYVGAGFGVALNQIKRTYSETGECLRSFQQWNDPFDLNNYANQRPVCTAAVTNVSSSGSRTDFGLGFAGALMAGVGYELRDGIVLDVGYRYLLQTGNLGSTALAGPPGETNKIELGGRADHEINTSIRWSLN